MIMEYLISTLLPASAEHSVVNILAQSDFALESFGNAKTINNPNSSRFVKFLNLAIVEPPRPKKPKSAFTLFCDQIRQQDSWKKKARREPLRVINKQLKEKWEALHKRNKKQYELEAVKDAQRYKAEMAAFASSHTGQLTGASVNAALLERNRVCGLTSGDPFHIFKYLQESDAGSFDGRPQGDLARVASWLEDIGFGSEEVDALFELVRASQLFVAVTFDSADRVSTDGDSQAALQRLAQMLSVRPTDLTTHLNDAVAPRVAQTVSTTPDSPRSRAVKSSIAKTLYDGVFDKVLQMFNTHCGADARFVCDDKHTCTVCQTEFVLPRGVPPKRAKFLCWPCFEERAPLTLSSIGGNQNSANTCSHCSLSAAPTLVPGDRWGGRCGFCRKVFCPECSTTSLPRCATHAARRLGCSVRRLCYGCISKVSVSHSQDAYFLGMLDIFGCERAYRGPIAGVYFLSHGKCCTQVLRTTGSTFCASTTPTNACIRRSWHARPPPTFYTSAMCTADVAVGHRPRYSTWRERYTVAKVSTFRRPASRSWITNRYWTCCPVQPQHRHRAPSPSPSRSPSQQQTCSSSSMWRPRKRRQSEIRCFSAT